MQPSPQRVGQHAERQNVRATPTALESRPATIGLQPQCAPYAGRRSSSFRHRLVDSCGQRQRVATGSARHAWRPSRSHARRGNRPARAATAPLERHPDDRLRSSDARSGGRGGTPRLPARRSRSTRTTSCWKKRAFRTRSRLIRLAVRLAMQPDANLSRALAMSVRGVSTFTPTASIDSTSDATIAAAGRDRESSGRR